MKFYRPVVSGVIDGLHKIYNENKYADKVIEYSFKDNKKWGSRDRHFVAFNIYEAVRWWRTLCSLAEIDFKKSQYTDDELVDILSIQFMRNYQEVPEGFPSQSIKAINEKLEKLNLAEKHSLSDELIEAFEADFSGQQLEEVLEALNKPAEVYLRANTLRGNRVAALKELQGEKVQIGPVDGSEVCMMLAKRTNVFATKSFKKGLFEMQDFGSQKIAEFCQVQPGDRVIDACAGAGGKTLYLSALMKNSGKIISMDIHEWKLNELKKRAKRSGSQNIETKLIESSKTIKRLKGSADIVLLDVPCSGSGVLRRNPDTKWKFTSQSLKEVEQLQKEILGSYAKMCKDDGSLIYSTCSLFESENQNQVKLFLSENPDWELLEEKQILPQDFNCDGFYMARLKKTIN